MRTHLISNEERAYLRNIEDYIFFDIQAILCKVIPSICTNSSAVMDLVQCLVERSNQDSTAYLPNSAFRKWCEADLSRADEVIKLAKGGNVTAREYLTFALEARTAILEAISCLERSPREQRAGALALSRMQLNETQFSIALEKIVRLAKEANTQTAYQLYQSSL